MAQYVMKQLEKYGHVSPAKTTTLSAFAQRHSVRKGQSNTDAKQ